MANHILRLQGSDGLSNTIKHWDDSVQYQQVQIDAIKSTNPASIKEPTSIPSPFARFALAKSAFSIVANEWDKSALVYQKIVSDCLDVAQIFFNYDKYRGFLEIIEWNKLNDLAALNSSNAEGNKKFAQALNLFLGQDAANYNFLQMNSIFFLKCTDSSAQTTNHIIGSTSPTTLFISSANDLSYVSKLIDFGGDRPFDGDYKPLCERYIEFQKYWYLLRMSNPNFAIMFPEVDAYLTRSYDALSPSDREAINTLIESDLQGYDDITVGGAGNRVNILGINLKKEKPHTQIHSDFEILSNHTINGVKPLALPIDRFAQRIRYVTANWDPDTKVPIFDHNPITNRTLPGNGSTYPYLTISDFLEDTIISLPYELTHSSYFNGNLIRAGGKSYLLPIKDLFFDFFSTQEVKKMIALESNAGGVTLKLNIPIQKNRHIVYLRNYFSHNEAQVNSSENSGAIAEGDFVFALFPNVKFQNEKDAVYRFGLISDFQNSEYFHATFYSKGLKNEKLAIRNVNNRSYKQCKNYVLNQSNFDYIRINYKNRSGIIIPNFIDQGGSDQFTFAIDLGTTNTHIEYREINKGVTKPFDIKDDRQIHSSSYIVSDNYIFDFDFIPGKIGEEEEFTFPIRTSLSEAKNINWDSAYPMADANIPFPYEKRDEYKYNRIITGLKWSNERNNMQRVGCYIDTLFLLLRNKVLLSNGDLSATKIIWFWPISMTQSRFNLFRKAWEESYQKYFGGQISNIVPVTESIAPYEFYKRQVAAANNMVSIDIGGGTTDIVIADKTGVKFITSFRFAADTIFGDGYAEGGINGIIRQFKDQIVQTLSAANMDDLISIYETLNNRNISSDIASFFFSLKDNKEIKGKNLSSSVDFNKILQADESQKIIFVFFYTAIIYHLAQLMLAKELPMPRHLTFSGNGSKVLQVLTTDNLLLEKFTKLIFERVYDKPYLSDGLTIVQNIQNPKEATCKGGIAAPAAQDYDQIAQTKTVFINAQNGQSISKMLYKDLSTEKYIESISEEAKEFIRFVFDLNNSFSYRNNFGISPQSLAIAKEHSFRDLNTYAFKGLARKKAEVEEDDPIEETFFFYPLNGMITALTEEIFNQSIKMQ